MSYPGENENKEYMDYVIEMQSNGNEPLPKEAWRKKKKEEASSGMTTALSNY